MPNHPHNDTHERVIIRLDRPLHIATATQTFLVMLIAKDSRSDDLVLRIIKDKPRTTTAEEIETSAHPEVNTWDFDFYELCESTDSGRQYAITWKPQRRRRSTRPVKRRATKGEEVLFRFICAHKEAPGPMVCISPAPGAQFGHWLPQWADQLDDIPF